MQRESFTAMDPPAPDVERLEREELRNTFASLQIACVAAGLDVQSLLARPGCEVIEFAQAHAIDIRDLRDICEILILRLDSLDQEFATIERLLSH